MKGERECLLVLKSILEAQDKVSRHHCETSCNQSINELLGKQKKMHKNTIPFILYGSENKPFEATGVTTYNCDCCDKEKFLTVNTFILKIKEIKGHCAILELLTFKSNHHESGAGSESCLHAHEDSCSPSCQLDGKNVKDLTGTGLCLNVDISCFCAITCLPAVWLKK